MLDATTRLFDALERRWNAHSTHAAIGVVLVATFLGALLAVELRRRGLLAPWIAARVPATHFGAVSTAFSLLLATEVFALGLALAQSVSRSVGKQFELLSLILLRKSFLAFGALGEPIEWRRGATEVSEVLADMVGALAIFVLVELYYRTQRHQPITSGEREQASFVAWKKLIALALLGVFLAMGVNVVLRLAQGVDTPWFFEVFYTLLIFADILLILVSLCYSTSYHVIFRNSGYAAATVMIRLALTAPPIVNAALGVGAALYVLLLALAYNRLSPATGITGESVTAELRTK